MVVIVMSNNNNIYSNGCNSYSNNYNSNSIGSSTTPQRKLFMKQVLDDPMSEVYQTYQVLRTRSSPLQMYLIEIVDLCTNQEAGVTEIIMPYMTCNLRTFATQRLKDSFHSLLRENHDMIQWNIHSLCLVLDMMHQCANGLQCWNEIAQKRHNDVKPENFLVDDGHALNFSSFSNFCVYLADLDESDDNYSCSNRSRSGTLHYFPPETGTRRSTRSDIWSFGVMCLELLCLLHQLHYSNDGQFGIDNRHVTF
ncbi:hypothetical protein C9374_002903 [Naegleria lovaniensis]|uniref:Protein kinase domain-containing protein n=1 Tax=Naegleria lovaniensis TaxID=51637 RepID=A0AA88GTB9_NAELO|nr:uncharacterized protein C9374_002903 [Naegleria lovaniensis]KAG2385754.1 hypothetical protein C9374_002903 [Naegleria lovaniensis]